MKRKVLAKSVLVLGVYPGFRKSPTHRNVMKTKLDETNLAIIKALRNGRASFRDIAADLGLSEVTVRTRAARLIEDGVLDICGQVDVEKLPGHTLALVAIKLLLPRISWARAKCSPTCGAWFPVGRPDGAARPYPDRAAQ